MPTIVQCNTNTIDAILDKHFPHFINVETGTLEFYTFGREVRDPELAERFGVLATVWGNGEASVNLDAKWDFWHGYRFKDEQDAVYFKLRYCG